MYLLNKSSAYLWALRNMPPCVHHFLVTLIICLSLSHSLNPLNTKLNPICHLLALLEAHHILHVSRMRVNNYELIGDFAQSEPYTYFAAQSVRPWTPPLCFDPANSLFDWRAIDTCGLFTAEPEMPTGFKTCSFHTHFLHLGILKLCVLWFIWVYHSVLWLIWFVVTAIIVL